MHGLHAVRAVVEGGVPGIEAIYHLEGRHDERIAGILELARSAGTDLHAVTRAELDRLAQGGNHQGIVAALAVGDGRGVAERSAAGLLEWLLRGDRPDEGGPPLVLVLDGVQDPHNLGACLRTAGAAGADAVLVPRDGAVGLTATVRKVASGAAERVPLFRATNLGRSLDELKRAGFWVHGAAGEADVPLWDVRFDGPCVVVCGSEGGGLRRLTRERCDVLFRIPMAGGVESLNVGVAAGVALFEVRRQRAATG